MKKTILIAVFLLCGMSLGRAESTSTFVSLTEGQQLQMCGGPLLRAGTIWVNDGVTQINLSTQEKKNSKPISGSYAWGEAIEVDAAHPGQCLYYVTGISKNDATGRVTLSKTPPKAIPGEMINRPGIK